MKRKYKFAGFTLLELIIVIIILGVLATLGFSQYGALVERSRGAEAKIIIGDIRNLANAHVLENGLTASLNNTNVNIGAGGTQIPNACRPQYFFGYGVGYVNPTLTITATRCTAGGKTPDRLATGGPWTLTLVLPLDGSGTDTWGGTGGY